MTTPGSVPENTTTPESATGFAPGNNGSGHASAPAANPDSEFEPHGAQAFGGEGPRAPVTDLSVFDDEYDEAEAPSYDEVPDGKYQVRVQRVEMAQSQNGDPMLKWDLVVISGQLAGRHVFKNSVITHKSLPFVKGDLQTLGVQLPRFSELPEHLNVLLDQTLEITKRTKGEYANVYFNRRLEVLESDGVSDEPSPF